MLTPPVSRPSFAPSNWLGWISFGLIWVAGKLPRSVAHALAVPLGWIMRLTLRRRYRIAKRNIDRCFHDKTAAERKKILNGCFDSAGRMVFETAWSWSASERAILNMSEIHGLEHLVEAHQRGKGVLLMGPHSTSLDIGGRILGCHFHHLKGMYRPLKSPVLEWLQTHSRSTYSEGMITKYDSRAAVRYLRSGGVLWYAPDQDFGPDRSEFVPFFGISTATLLAIHRMPQVAGCETVMMLPSYDSETGRYRVEITPVFEDFPGDDPVVALTRVNAVIEAFVRKFPEQYWWVHRRFKTRPPGEPPFYD